MTLAINYIKLVQQYYQTMSYQRVMTRYHPIFPVMTCDDNPNLEETALLKNSNSKVTVRISPEGLRWVQHSVPIIPSGLKSQVAGDTDKALLKVR